jgi:hypothetical protein
MTLPLSLAKEYSENSHRLLGFAIAHFPDLAIVGNHDRAAGNTQ